MIWINCGNKVCFWWFIFYLCSSACFYNIQSPRCFNHHSIAWKLWRELYSFKQTNKRKKKIHKNICELLMVVPWTNHVKSNYTEQLSHSYDYTCTYYQCHTNFYFVFNCCTMTTIYCLTKVTFLHLISFNNGKKPSVKQMRNEFKSLFKPFSISLWLKMHY